MKGIYVCLFKIPDATIEVGSLGKITFEEGLYAYVGSAQKDAEKRIMRHKNGANNKRWHVDYISSRFPAFMCMLLKDAPRRMEEELALYLEEIYPSVMGFGASDSHLKSHLFRVDDSIESVLYNFSHIFDMEWVKL